MVFRSRNSRKYKVKSQGQSEFDNDTIGAGNFNGAGSHKMNVSEGLKFKYLTDNLSASCDQLDSREGRARSKSLGDDEDANQDVNKRGFFSRVFGKKYRKLKRAKSQDILPTKVLNISLEDAMNKKTRDRSRNVPAELWQESEEKTKRRMAVCEDDETNRQGFSKIVETFIVQKNMDDYCF